jgi:hypothetical protein
MTPKTSNLWLSHIGDIGTLLLSHLSISQLQDVALVKYLSTQCVIFAISLTKEILQHLESSPTAISYFVRGLLLPHITGFFSSPSSLLRYQEMKRQTIESSLSPSSSSSSDFMSPLLGLDQLIMSLLTSTKLVQSSPELISQFIDALKLSIIPFLSLLKSSSSFPSSSSSLSLSLPPLQSPLHSLNLCVNLLNNILNIENFTQRNELFWMTAFTSIHEFFHTIKPLDLTVTTTSTSTSTTTNAIVVSHLLTLMEYLSRTLHGIGQMKISQIQNFIKTETKFLFSQIRSLNFSSPLVIPNASTQTGDYTIGIWIKIPVFYYQQIIQYEENPGNVDNREKTKGKGETSRSAVTSTPCEEQIKGENMFPSNALKTHLLSRVPEAGEIDMTSLFLDSPLVTPCSPGIILLSLPDNTARVIVTFTVYSQNYSTGTSKKLIRLVKLSSHLLPIDEWLDVMVHYEPLRPQNDDGDGNDNPLIIEKGEKARVSLSVNGVIHASTEDYFGRFVLPPPPPPPSCLLLFLLTIFLIRISLHQNLVFGTTPISLIKPSAPHLLAGGLRWTTQSHPTPTPPLSPALLQDHFIEIRNSENISKILIPHLPLVSLQDLITETSTACLNCATVTSKFLQNLSLHLLNSFKAAAGASRASTEIQNNKHSDGIFEEIFQFLQTIPHLGSLAVSVLGVGTPAIDVRTTLTPLYPPPPLT